MIFVVSYKSKRPSKLLAAKGGRMSTTFMTKRAADEFIEGLKRQGFEQISVKKRKTKHDLLAEAKRRGTINSMLKKGQAHGHV